jgi:hypothetical protein
VLLRRGKIEDKHTGIMVLAEKSKKREKLLKYIINLRFKVKTL